MNWLLDLDIILLGSFSSFLLTECWSLEGVGCLEFCYGVLSSTFFVLSATYLNFLPSNSLFVIP